MHNEGKVADLHNEDLIELDRCTSGARDIEEQGDFDIVLQHGS
jgi:hypothetical protein